MTEIEHRNRYWWNTPLEMQFAMAIAKDCTVGVHVRVVRDSVFRDRLFSGVVVEWKGRTLWFSAGHALEHIREAVDDERNERSELHLVDAFERKGAETVGIAFDVDRLFDMREPCGLDFGFLPLSELAASALRANSEFQPFVLDEWRSPSITPSTGLVVAGYPTAENQSMVTERTERVESGGLLRTRETRHLRATLVCLPLSRPVSPRRLRHTGMKLAAGTEIVGLLTESDAISDITGISGGPVFAIRRGRAGYRQLDLYGLEVSWKESTRYVRIIPFESIAKALELLLLSLFGPVGDGDD